MVDCTSDLNDLQANVTRCEYHISIENDPDNWWYSPFDATGLSGSYSILNGGPGSAFDRGSAEFDTFSTTRNIQCSTGSDLNWTQATAGKCIDVDPADQSKLADSQVSATLDQTQCTGGTFPGIEEWVYEGVITLPLQCDDWIISTDECCRNNAITNINNPGAENIYVETLINNTAGVGCNNSPEFTNPPVSFICANQLYCYNKL